MCGLAGVFGGAPVTGGRRKAVLQAMAHRGPDAAADWSGTLAGQPLTLLHTRLSILDPQQRSDQPFVRDGLVLVYNGEIYNFEAIRQELESLGHRFVTRGDTEVILEAYREWGTDAVRRFEGMWAFALADLNQGILWLSRDRFGEKTLYLMQDEGAFYFASETRALWQLAGRRQLADQRQLLRYLVNGYKSLGKGRDTFYQGVHEIRPATNLILEEPARCREEPYWNLEYAPVRMSCAEAEEQAAGLLEKSMKLRLRSDVPLAFCLSGGIDSSTLVSMAAKKFGCDVHAYSVYDSDERYDESENAELVVSELGCHHHVAHTAKTGFRDRLTKLINDRDQPFSTLSFYLVSFLAERIQQDGFKVALTGNGADELFTGYYDHFNFWLASLPGTADMGARVAEWQDSYGRFVRNPVLRDPLAFRKEPERRDHIYLNRDLFNSILRSPFDEDFSETVYGEDLLHSRMLNEIRHEALPPQLRENDLVFMQYSIENRTPYLDRELAEFLFSVPLEHLIVNGYPKWLLRAAGKGLYSDKIRLDKYKRGFNASITALFDPSKGEDRDWLLEDGPLFDLVDRSRLSRMLETPADKNSVSKFLFNILNVKVFLEAQGAA
jgi:asparagine synthase (glutamine-hydrolysing)